METKLQQGKKLVLARAAAVVALAGRSPRERGDEKTMLALDWIYRWGWASPSTIEMVGGGGRTGLAVRLVKRKFLRATVTESGGAQKGVPSKILTLTDLGQSEVERFREDLLPYDQDPYRIRQSQLRHYQMAQTTTITLLSEGKISGFATERELSEKSEANIKQPDILWYYPSGIKVGVEVELTAKWGRDMDTFVRSCLSALSTNRLDTICIVTDSKAIFKRYQAAFKPEAGLPTWEKVSQKWAVTGRKQVPDWAREKIFLKLIEDPKKQSAPKTKNLEPSE